MHIKKDFNFFSSQNVQKTKTIAQVSVIAIIAATLVVVAVLTVMWGTHTIADEESKIADANAQINNPELAAKLQEVDQVQAQPTNLEAYTTLAAITLTKIDGTHYASSAHLNALLAEIPASVEVSSLDIQGGTWHLECKTNNPKDVAILLHDLDASATFQNAMVGSMNTDETGMITFPVDVMLEGGASDAAK